MRFREDRLKELLKSKSPPWTLGQLHVQARRFRPTLAWRTLSEIVNGKRQPSFEVVGALAAALDVDPSYLLDLPDEVGEAAEVVAERAELAPEVLELARDIDDLPSPFRALVVALLDHVLVVLKEAAGLTASERKRQWLNYLATLPEEDLAVLAEQAAQAETRRVTGGEQRDERLALEG